MHLLALAALILPGAARAGSDCELGGDVGGQVKSFFVSLFPYEHVLMPEDPLGYGIWSARLLLGGELDGGDRSLRLVVHGATTATAPTMDSSLGTLSISNTGGLPEAVDLSWSLDGGDDLDGDDLDGDDLDGDDLDWTARPDRLVLEGSIPHVDLAVGRQAITFGRAVLFTPLDLVAPFHPAVIDQEYKPGADAVRLDGYVGMSQLSLVAAYAGDWNLEGSVISAYGQATVGLWDLGGLVGSVRGDRVAGLTAVGSVGPVGLWAEGTYTLPPEGDDDDPASSDPFFRGVVGTDARPGDRSYVTAELYYQSLGATDPGDYLLQTSSERYDRGELWAAGQWYLGASTAYELTPLVTANAFALVNLLDPSAMLGPGLSWSVADEVSFSAGGYLGVGERPGDVDLAELAAAGITDEEALLDAIPVESEFGMVPAMAFATLIAYF